MRGLFNRKNTKQSGDTADIGEVLSPLPGLTAAGWAEQHTPVPGLTDRDVGGGKKGSIYDDDKVYLGVRVKMPVRDLLRNIRGTQGWEPEKYPEIHGKTVKGEGKRVRTRPASRTKRKKLPSKSQEELAIIVEVLEDDLRSSPNYHSPQYSPTGAGYNSDYMIPSPQSYMSLSPGPALSPQALSPFPGFMQPSSTMGDFDPPSPTWSLDTDTFFSAQLQREESKLSDICDDVLLATDEQGSTAFHKVVCVGKRALGYAIAKRMAALNELDLKDSNGMTALLLAAQHNHHLMVLDLIRLGANVNEMNNTGKSCLHLSAEKGYIRVLEVLKHAMLDGVYVDVEATDNSGMSVLQCTAVALKAAVSERRGRKSLKLTRLHSLRQEQMMETLECLLKMGSYLHTMGGQSVRPRMGQSPVTWARQGFLETRQ